MSRRTLFVAAAGVVAVAVTALVVVLVGGSGSGDPNETAVTELCRDAAVDEPVMTEGVAEFTVSDVTHETEGGATFYRAYGSASTSDGFGGTEVYDFTCDTKLVGDGDRWELLDIMLS